MSRDSLVKAGLLLVMATATGALFLAAGLSIPRSEWVVPVGAVSVLAPCAAFYQWRRSPELVMSLLAAMQMVVYTSCFTMLMYAVATWSFPLADGGLMQADAALGVHLPSIVAWTAEHPRLALGLEIVYATLMLQTIAVVVLLGFTGRRRALEGFVLQFMLATIVTAACFAFLPAEGPFAAYGYAPSEKQATYLDHLHTLRNGDRRTFSFAEAEGLITFPSFHVAWAMLLAWATRRFRTGSRWLIILFTLLNAAVIVSTLTTGWHYFADVLGGGLLAVGVIGLTRRLEPWLYPADSGCVNSAA